MAATSENKSMMIVWVVGAVLVVLGIYLAIPGTPAEKTHGRQGTRTGGGKADGEGRSAQASRTRTTGRADRTGREKTPIG